MPPDGTPLHDFLGMVNKELNLGINGLELDGVARTLHENSKNFHPRIVYASDST